MIVPPQKQPRTHITIDLSGPEGNAFALIGLAKRLAKQHGLDPEPIVNKMMSDDYANAVHTLNYHFGHCLVLIEPPGGLY